MSPLTGNDLKRIFEKLDKNGDGVMSIDELNRLLDGVASGFQLSAAELESLVGKTSLDFDEFLLFYESISNQYSRTSSSSSSLIDSDETVGDDLVKAFKVFDQNDDGFISCDELQSVLTRLGFMEESCGRDCRSMIGPFDANSDGKLDFEEFKNMMLLTIS